MRRWQEIHLGMIGMPRVEKRHWASPLHLWNLLSLLSVKLWNENWSWLSFPYSFKVARRRSQSWSYAWKAGKVCRQGMLFTWKGNNSSVFSHATHSTSHAEVIFANVNKEITSETFSLLFLTVTNSFASLEVKGHKSKGRASELK